MSIDDSTRPMGNTPVTDAASVDAPQPATPQNYGSNADVRLANAAPRERESVEDQDADPEEDETVGFGQDDDAQEEAAAQAQTVADDAIRGLADQQARGDSEHNSGDSPLLGADDIQDTVDHMNQMETSGIIDNDAYRGERNDDDEPESLGEGGMEPEDLDEHGNKARGSGQDWSVE